MRLVKDVVVPVGSVKFSINVGGMQVLFMEIGMESHAVQVPAARTAWLQVVDHLDDGGSRLCRAEDSASVVRVEGRPVTTPWC